MLILDTDAISIIQRGSSDRRFKPLVHLLDKADDDVYVTVISLDEQLHGALNEIQNKASTIRIRGYRRLREIVQDYHGRPMLDYDVAAESVFEKLKGLKGRPATKDLRIASVALSHGAMLVTGNSNDFSRIPELRLLTIP